MGNKPATIAMETYARRSFNYLENMVDANSLPYFNIFWAEPAEAAHDWPDFGDVMGRQLQGAVMGRIMAGEGISNEEKWLTKLLGEIDPETGLLTRPDTNYSKKIGDAGDNMLTLYGLVTQWVDSHDPTVYKAACGIVDGLLKNAKEQGTKSNFLSGFGIKSAMVSYRYLGYEPALELAQRMVKEIFVDNPYFSPDNTFKHGGHMHGNLRSLVGAADYALSTHDPILYSRVDAIYRYVRSQATSFGFLPEAIGRKGDVVSCETCAIMDYLGLAITLANHGHPEYWDDIERVARNHMIESQVVDTSWLVSDPARKDTTQFSWNHIGERMVGGYAGWSSPNHILAARENLNAHWGGPELHDKTRAFQNCCGGSGTHAFFEIWKNSARFEDHCLSINMHLDKLLPQAEIRCYQPYTGLLIVKLTEPAGIKVRIPEFIKPAEMRAEIDGNEVQGRVWGNYLEFESQPAQSELRISYPLPIFTEEVKIGNPGYRQYTYRVTWKGSTVIKMEPIANDFAEGYSEFDKKNVAVFYGEEGPGKLYQREAYRQDASPEGLEKTVLQMDNGLLDFWKIQ